MLKMSPAQEICGAHDENQPSMWQIIKQVFSEGYINDHNKNGGLIVPNAVIVRTCLLNGYSEVCPAVADTIAFCLNPFYLDETDNHIHMSTCSVGGDIILKGKSLEDAVSIKNAQEMSSQYATLHEICSIVYKNDVIKAIQEA